MKYPRIFLTIVCTLLCYCPMFGQISIPLGGNLTISQCEGTLLDTGGDGVVVDNSSGIVTIIAPPEAGVITITVQSFDMEPFNDYLSVYDGASTAGTFLGQFTGTELSVGQEIVSSGPAITFEQFGFFSGIDSNPGFEISWSWDCSAVNTAPVAAFSTSTIACNGEASFSDASNGFPASWEWDFGDGNTSTEQNPIHVYENDGIYDVTLTVCNIVDCSTTTVVSAISSVPCEVYSQSIGEQDEFTDCFGTLLDNGGEANYQFESTSVSTISVENAEQLQLVFEQFQLYQFGGEFNIYLGPDTDSPLYGTYTGSSISQGTVFTLDSPTVTLELTALYDVGPGFVMHWAAPGGITEPVAAIGIPDANPPMNHSALFNDASVPGGAIYEWDFGDGNTSAEPNPTHAFTIPGEYDINLTVRNCFGESIAETQTITVQDPANIIVTPTNFDVTLNAGEVEVREVKVANIGGGGDLIYEVLGLGDIVPNKTRIVGLTNGVDLEQEYTQTMAALDAKYSNYLLDTLRTEDAQELSAALLNADVLLIYELAACNPFVIQELSGAIQSFTESGGTTIILGTNKSSCVFGTGLFEGSYIDFLTGQNVTVLQPNDPLADGVPSSFVGSIATFQYSFTNPDVVSVVGYENADVVAYRPYGEGQAIFMGFDYYNWNEASSQLLANAVKGESFALSAQWLRADPAIDTIPSIFEKVVNLTFDAQEASAGVYQDSVLVRSNAVNFPEIFLFAKLTVLGEAAIEISAENLEYGNQVQFTSQLQEVVISNSGSDTLFVTSIAADDSAFELNFDEIILEPGYSSLLTVTFSPDEIQEYNGTITISTNLGEYTIDLSGAGTGAPIASSEPEAIEVTLEAGESTTTTVNLSNIGQGDLEYEATLGSFADPYAVLDILVLTRDLNTFGFNIVKEGLDGALDNYTLTEFNPADPSDLEAALAQYRILMIPPNFGNPTYAEFASVVQGFLEDGGVVVSIPGTNASVVYQLGLFEGEFITSFFTELETYVALPDHPIAEGVDQIFLAGSASYVHNFTNPNIDKVLVTSEQESLLAVRRVGEGTIIHLPWTYDSVNEQMEIVTRNAFNFAALSAAASGWLDVELSDGVIPFPDGQLEYEILIDTEGLIAGTYQSSIDVISNDPQNPTYSIPITLVVTGQPLTTASLEELDFGSVVVGASNTLTVDISNTGTDTLLVDQMLLDFPDDYSFEPAELAILPGSTQTVSITFAPTEVGPFDTNLSFDSNEAEATTIGLLGNGQPAPAVALGNEEISVTLLEGETTQETIVLTNNGDGPLSWSIAGGPDDEVKVAFVQWNADFSAMANVREAVSTNCPDHISLNIESNNPQEVQQVLDQEVDVVIIPRGQDYIPEQYAAFAEVLPQYIEDGGTVIMTGTFCDPCVFNTGVFSGFYQGSQFATTVTITEDHPITADLDPTFVSSQSVFALTLSNPDAQTVATFQNWDGSAFPAYQYAESGFGKAVFIGSEFSFAYDVNEGKALGNAVKWGSGALPGWLDLSDFEGEVAPGESVSITVDFDATGLLADVYDFVINISNNDPLEPNVQVPVTMNVIDFPNAALTSDVTLACGDGTVQFSDLSQNTPTSWEWDFGDGNTSTEQNPIHEYTEEGIFTVSLNACNDLGCDEFIVENMVAVDFDCLTAELPLEVLANDTVTACNGILYDMGGTGSYPNQANASTTIMPDNSLNVTINIEELQTESTYDFIYIYDGPTIDPETLVGQYDGSTIPNDGVFVNGMWTSSGPAVTIQFTSDISQAQEGFKLSWQCTLAEIPPIPDFAYSFVQECTGEVFFSDSTALQVDEWLWDFGDGNTSNEQNPTHLYSESGSYEVSLTGTNQYGTSEPFTTTVDVIVLPASFTSNPSEGFEVGQVIFFDGFDAGPGVTYEWTFGTGSGETNYQQDPIQVYSEEGEYVVTLKVSTSDDCFNIYQQTILITAVGVEDAFGDALQIFPNPADEQVAVKLDFDGSKFLDLSVIDALGRTVLTQKQNALNGLQLTLDVSSLSAGMYNLSISDEQKTANRKLMIK